MKSIVQIFFAIPISGVIFCLIPGSLPWYGSFCVGAVSAMLAGLYVEHICGGGA